MCSVVDLGAGGTCPSMGGGCALSRSSCEALAALIGAGISCGGGATTISPPNTCVRQTRANSGDFSELLKCHQHKLTFFSAPPSGSRNLCQTHFSSGETQCGFFCPRNDQKELFIATTSDRSLTLQRISKSRFGQAEQRT